eukprot:6492534-Amphidinium_carterae.1
MARTEPEPESELDSLVNTQDLAVLPLGATESSNTSSAGQTVVAAGSRAVLPLVWRLDGPSLCIYDHSVKVYVIWRCGLHPRGEHYWSGIHLGADPWGRLCDAGVFVGNSYLSQRDHCRRVRHRHSGQDWIAAARELYSTEATRHGAPSTPTLWLWDCAYPVDHKLGGSTRSSQQSSSSRS